MLRVLHIVGRMDRGGQETFIMNLYRKIDRKKIQFDFVVNSEKIGDYEQEILSLGGKIYRIKSMLKNPLIHIIELKRILKSNNYQIIHRHTSSAIILPELIVAKYCNINNIIVHSHNTSTNRKVIHYLCRPFMNKLCNYKFACGKEAGEWLYGKKQKFEIVNNGIDIKKYKYDISLRKKVRENLDINEDEFVLGNVARFNIQKNHKFIIEIFNEVLKIKPNSLLLLIGEGEEKENIKKICEDKKITNKVKFLGIRRDVNEILQALDVFIFPSLFEGLPVTLIEAQASGLKIYASNTISPDVNITNNIEFISLNCSANNWAKKIVFGNNNRNERIDLLYNSYDISEIAKNLEKKYYNMYKEKK